LRDGADGFRYVVDDAVDVFCSIRGDLADGLDVFQYVIGGFERDDRIFHEYDEKDHQRNASQAEKKKDEVFDRYCDIHIAIASVSPVSGANRPATSIRPGGVL
jgi:hypothetical protein